MNKKNVSEKTLPQLRAEVTAIREEISNRESAEALAKNGKFVGCAFVKNNCYPGAKSSADYWKSFTLVTGLSVGGGLDAIQIQRDFDNRVLIEKIHTYPNLLGDMISKKRFEEESKKILLGARKFLGLR